MKQSLSIILLALAGLAGTPALADHEQYRHGQDDAATPAITEPAPARDQDMAATADNDGMDDMKSGGKSCKKCKKGMGGGGDAEAPGHDHGADDATGKGGKGGKGGMGMMGMKGMKGMAGKSDTEALEARVRQLEKRLDLMQTMLEMMAERRAGGAGGGGHH